MRAVTTTNEALLDDGDDARFRQFIYDVLAFGTRLEAVRDGLGELMGLTGPQYSILITIGMLQEKGKRTAVVDIADYMHVSGAFITAEVAKLVKAGLVEKEADAEDRRRVVLALTETADERLRDLTEFQVPVNNLLFGALSREQFEMLSSVLPNLLIDAETAMQEINHFLRKRRLQLNKD